MFTATTLVESFEEKLINQVRCTFSMELEYVTMPLAFWSPGHQLPGWLSNCINHWTISAIFHKIVHLMLNI